MSTKADRIVLGRAEQQYGVVSKRQALRAGLSVDQIKRRTGSGAFEALFPGVFRIAGSPRTGRQRAQAALLWLGDAALISFMTAAALLRLDGCRTRELHVSVPRDNRKRSKTMVTHRTLWLPRSHRVNVDGLRCTSASRTLVDIASLLDEEALEVAFESARRMGLTSALALQRAATPVIDAGGPGAGRLRRLLEHQRPGEPALQYRLEVKAARLIRASDLPRFERQVPVGPYHIDFARPDLMYGVECEGFDYHGSRLAWKRDKLRTSYLESRGWRLTFVSWDDVTQRPDETLRRISLALGLVAV
jgi:very-short-patch-repair endonuclease